MLRPFTLSLAAALTCALVWSTACGGDTADTSTGQSSDETNQQNGHDDHHHDHGHADEGVALDLGTQQAGPYLLRVTQIGLIALHHELVFDLATVPADATAVRAWFGGDDRTLHTVTRGHKEEGGWHLHLEPLDALDPAYRLHVEVEDANGQAHGAQFETHWAGPHGGVIGKLLRNGSEAGWVEVMLHEDGSAVELWAAQDRMVRQPLHLPADAAVGINVPTHNRQIRLVPRTSDEPTNHFVFPGDTGADAGAAWLRGHEAPIHIVVTLDMPQGPATSEAFPLVPMEHDHDHGDHHDHDHDHGDHDH